MKKVLILAYDFPPYISVGALRPAGWYKHFHEFGVFPIVVTRQWDNKNKNYLDYISPSESNETIIENTEFGTIIKAPFKPHFGNKIMLKYGEKKFRLIRKFFSGLFELIQFLFFAGNKSTIYFAAKEYLKNNKVDVIIASGDPFILFKYASKLSKKYDIHWIADYRDPWSKTDENTKLFAQKILERFFEKRYNKTASKIISVSEIMYNQILSNNTNKYEVIKNGYEDSLFNSLKDIEQNSSVFSIALAGSIYKHHPIESFLKVCNTFVKNNPNIKFQLSFYGINIEAEIKKFVNKECSYLVPYVVYTAKLANSELVKKLATHNLLLLFNAYATTGTKIYEYLALKRKIIFCYSDDEEAKLLFEKYYRLNIDGVYNHHLQEDIINETNSGIIIKNASHLKDVIQELYDEFTENKFIECNSKNIEIYSKSYQIKKLADIVFSFEKTVVPKLKDVNVNTQSCKKALILAYDFPPYISVGGLRPYNWYKYLNQYGVYPIVVTRQWNNQYGNYLDYIAPSDSKKIISEVTESGTIIKTPYFPNLANRILLNHGKSKYVLFRKFIAAYYQITQWIWKTGPKMQIYYSAKEFLKNNNVDAIIATGDPFILFKYASQLSDEYKTPWIADYRDPWTQDKGTSVNFLLKIINTHFEKKYLKNVSQITTVSDFFKAQISLLVKNKNTIIIPNGYDPKIKFDIREIEQQKDTLRIGFVGTISKWHPIFSFICVLSNFVSDFNDAKIEVNFYGINISEELQEYIDSNYSNIKTNIKIHPKVPNDKLLIELSKNNVMLLFNYYSIIGTKIYDYLAINRLILLCYSNDKEAIRLKEKYYIVNEIENFSQHLQEDLIKETNSGIIVENSAHLRIVLEELYLEFEKNGNIACNSKNVEQYSRAEQTKKLAEIIREL